MLRNTLAILFHLSPLVPLLLGHFAAAAALALVVLALYVKDQKLGMQERALVERAVVPYAEVVVTELAGLRAARKRWRYLQLAWFRTPDGSV